MSVKKYDDYEFNNGQRAFSMPVIIMTAVVSGVILLILLAVLASNNTTSGKNNRKNADMLASNDANTQLEDEVTYDYAYTGEKDIEKLYRENKLRAEDFDFWDMYGDRSNVHFSQDQSEEGLSDGSNSLEEAEVSASPTPSPTPTEEPLLEGVKVNNLDYSNIKIVDNKMTYSINGDKISHLGAMISKDNGVVDFNTLKNSGVDFVMIKVGSRGYNSGVIDEDPNLERNLKAAEEAGLDIGLYFSSRAVTTEEARQEAEYCISQSYGYDVSYPIAYVFDGTLIDEARTDDLDKKELTKNVEAFLSEVRMQGYTPILYGSEQFILEQITPDELLTKYDVMLNDQNLIPEYPYQYKMWRYSMNQIIPGIEKGGDYVISFVDYSGR